MKNSISLFPLLTPVKYLLLALSFRVLLAPVHAQIQQAWVAKYNNGVTNGQNKVTQIRLDLGGNIYLCGLSQNTNSGTGYATLKYTASGKQVWVARFDSANFPYAQPTSFALDAQTNIVVTGTAVTVKYNNHGSLLWSIPYNAAAISTDLSNDVYITGVNTNFLTMKFSPAGTNLWSQSYTTSYTPTISQAIGINAVGDVFVAGYGFNEPPSFFDRTVIILARYSAEGVQTWLVSNSPQVDGPAHFYGLTINDSGNIYLAFNLGGPPQPYETYAYSPGGGLLWAAYDPTQDVGSQCFGFALDHHTNIIITGANAYYYPNSTYGTYKISPSGAYLWGNTYPFTPKNTNAAFSVAVDQSDNCYITGFSADANGTNDIVTIAYDTNGKQLWLQRYSGLGYGAVGNAIAADNAGNIYVAGYENVPGGGTEMVLIKYSPFALQHQSNGNFLLQAQGSPGERFDIQASTNLQSWLDLGSQSADTNGLLQYLDTNAPLYPWRFYLAIPQ